MSTRPATTTRCAFRITSSPSRRNPSEVRGPADAAGNAAAALTEITEAEAHGPRNLHESEVQVRIARRIDLHRSEALPSRGAIGTRRHRRLVWSRDVSRGQSFVGTILECHL